MSAPAYHSYPEQFHPTLFVLYYSAPARPRPNSKVQTERNTVYKPLLSVIRSCPKATASPSGREMKAKEIGKKEAVPVDVSDLPPSLT